MATIYWKSTDSDWQAAPGEESTPVDLPTNEQHPVPQQLMWRSEGADDFEPLNEGHPAPVKLTAADDIWQVRSLLVQIEGTSTTAYVANDAVGTGQLLSGLGGPNKAFVVMDAFTIFGAAPTTTADGVNLDFYTDRIGPATDSSAFAPSFADEMEFAGEIKINEVVGGLATGLVSQATMTTGNQPRVIRTMPSGDIWLQAVCGSAFTLASGAVLFLRLNYRYANFQGVA